MNEPDIIAISEAEASRTDWFRVQMIKLKHEYRKEGLHEHYLRLLKDHHPQKYNNLEILNRVYNVWNGRTYDDTIKEDLEIALTKERIG